jgi:AAA+ ATPase superfamily predicted ATPase
MVDHHPDPFFIGREQEIRFLKNLDSASEAKILVLYGRRRVGKTELLEQIFRERGLLKFEGLEGQSDAVQRGQVLYELSRQVSDALLAKIATVSWKEVFEVVARYAQKGVCTLYFEEVQWLANYHEQFVSDLKWAWDNLFRHNSRLILILCGSSPSFMIHSVLRSKALYNRSQHELFLKEFSLIETREFFGKKRSLGEVLDAYLTLGGIPEYLKRIQKSSSLFAGICEASFKADGFFTNEYEKIFVSSLSGSKGYKKIVEYLAKHRFSNRDALLKFIGSESGGTPTKQFDDMDLCGFITKYSPYNLAQNSTLVRYAISDPYLQFYFKFIAPLQNRIESGEFNRKPALAIKMDAYRKWLGFAFERFCRRYQYVIAKILGFSGVNYRAGVYFDRRTNAANPGYQIDLIFDRDDKVNTVCEIKYLATPASSDVIRDFEGKMALFPNPKKKTIHRVLIAPQGADPSVHDSATFDQIITLDDLFDPHYW